MPKKTAVVGVSDHCGWSVLVTVAGDTMIDRRRVELIDDDLPKLPHHHDAQGLPMPEAIALIERVTSSARRRSIEALESLVEAVPVKIVAIALRRCPPLPPTIEGRLTDYRAQNVADSVMCREALVEAAKARDLRVHWYETKTVFAEAASVMKMASIDKFLGEVAKSAGRPWQKDHRVAMAAAIAASR